MKQIIVVSTKIMFESFGLELMALLIFFGFNIIVLFYEFVSLSYFVEIVFC